MNASDLNALVKGMAPAVRDAISTAMSDLDARVSLIEKASPLVVEGPIGPAGKDAEPVSIERLMSALAKDEQGLRTAFELMVHEAVEERLKALPVPEIVAGPPGPAGENGRDGVDGKDGQPFTIEQLSAAVAKNEHGMRSAIEMMLNEAAVEHLKAHPPAAGPPGERGADGAPGETGHAGPQGAPGTDGAPGASGQRGEPGMAGDVGQKGEQGIPGRDGLPGVQGPSGLNGADGVHGKDGAQGAPGRDGTLENLKIGRLDERTIQFQFKDGTPIEGGTIRLDHPRFKDTWGLNPPYDKGDVVQWAGSGWIALVENPTEKPGTGPPERTGWKMFIKQGAEGKTGKAGPAGERGPRGDQGPQGKAGY